LISFVKIIDKTYI